MRCLRPVMLASLLIALATAGRSAAPDNVPASPSPTASAHELFTARRDSEAKAAFEAILAISPSDADAEYHLGRLAKRSGDWETAAEHYKRCTQLAPTDALYWADLGEAYGKLAGKASVFRQLGLARRCRAALEKAVALAPDNLEYRHGLAEFYEKAPAIAGGGRNKALAQAAEIGKRDAYAGAMAAGKIHTRAEQWSDARAAFREALRLNPKSEAALAELAKLPE